jgi:hypothetical protein
MNIWFVSGFTAMAWGNPPVPAGTVETAFVNPLITVTVPS